MNRIRRAAAAGLATALCASLAACSGDDDAAGPGAADTSGPESSPTAPAPPVLGTWSELAPLPSQRTEVGAVAYDGLLYVTGGFAPGEAGPPQVADDLFIYDPGADTWREGAPMPESRHHAPMAAHDGKVYVVGGFVSFDPERRDTLFVYDVATDSWTEGPPMPERRAAHAVATTDEGHIHVLGGLDSGARDEHFMFDPATGEWSTLPSMPTRREHVGAAYLDGVIYVAAGRAVLDSAMRTFEAYDITTQEWTTLPDLPTGRSGVAVTAYDGHVYVFGGESFDPTRTYSEAERFDPVTGEWEAVTPMRYPRHGLGAGVVDGGIVVVSGGPEAGFSYSDVTEVWRP
jgi:N-acetylneuraminic acid mutarotase